MEEKSRLFLDILKKLQKEDVLSEFILIGSWCHFFYRVYFNNSPEIPLVRTLDLDLLIPNPPKIKKEIDVSELLKGLGFESIVSYPSGYVKFVHPELSVEFLIPELGKGRSKPYNIEKLHINAQGIRFLNILQKHVIKIKYNSIVIRIPEPAAYVLHKFIIGRRRKKKEKAERDLLSAKEIGEFLLQDENQRKRLREIFNGFPEKWQNKVKKSVEEISSTIYDFLVKA